MSEEIQLIDIPFVEHRLIVYTGETGRRSFNHHVEIKHPDWKDNTDDDGLHFENHIFVESPKNIIVLLHEFSHYLDWLFEILGCQEEAEFRAHLMGSIGDELIKWGNS